MFLYLLLLSLCICGECASVNVKLLHRSLACLTIVVWVLGHKLVYDYKCSFLFFQGSVSKATISPVPSSTHVRTLRKGSSDHIAVNIDSESSRLLDNEPVEDKGL